MNRNIRQTLLAPALLLLAAATLGLAGCTQGDDALPGADGNDGARTLNINVDPKQGFTLGNADDSRNNGSDTAPATRSTVDESTGVMAWQEGDRIFVLVECNDAANTMPLYTLIRNATNGWDIYEGYLTTYDADGNLIDLSSHTPVSAIKLPLGATAAVCLRVNYTDSPTRFVPESGPDIQQQERVDLQDGGSRDFMTYYISNPAMDASITIALTRNNLTRFHFPGGLTPGKKYYVDGFHSQTAFGRGMSDDGASIPFTAAPDGSLTLCALIDGASQTITLKEKDDDADDTNDKVVYTATFNVAHGSSYRCIIPVAGRIDPDSKPDLLKPNPIVAGNTVYDVNGYWVTAPDADAAKKYTWDAANNATTGPCVGHGNWRMPAMKDFEKMLDWSGIPSWTDSEDVVQRVDLNSSAEYDIWETAFQYYDDERNIYYWSSDSRQVSNNAWSLFRNAPSGYIKYSIDAKTSTYYVRCVQPQ